MIKEEAAIEIQGLCKTYPQFKLDQINLSIPKGYIVGLIGENGAGKTTVIKAILNLIHKESGSVSVFGKDHEENEKEMKRRIGIVFDDFLLHDFLNTSDISKIMKKIYSEWEEDIFASYCRKFDLPEKVYFKNYSRGMKTKLSIAIALSHHAELLIMDEATSGLDPVVREEILDILLEFIQEESHTVLISSHILSDLQKVADYIAFLHKGKLMFCKSKEELLQEYGVIHGTQEMYEKLDPVYIAGTRSNAFGIDILIHDWAELKRREPQILVEPASLEEIILYTVKGEKQ